MVFLKLFGHALGSVVMYWGLALFCIAFWFLGLLLAFLFDQAWRKLTGKPLRWAGFDSVGKLIPQLKFTWIGWLPGVFIQVWYAGYAADLVQSSTRETGVIYTMIVKSVGVLSIFVAVVVFYWLYRWIVEVKLNLWLYFLMGGTSLSAYFMFQNQAETATWLSASWQRVVVALLSEFIMAF